MVGDVNVGASLSFQAFYFCRIVLPTVLPDVFRVKRNQDFFKEKKPVVNKFLQKEACRSCFPPFLSTKFFFLASRHKRNQFVSLGNHLAALALVLSVARFLLFAVSVSLTPAAAAAAAAAACALSAGFSLFPCPFSLLPERRGEERRGEERRGEERKEKARKRRETRRNKLPFSDICHRPRKAAPTYKKKITWLTSPHYALVE